MHAHELQKVAKMQPPAIYHYASRIMQYNHITTLLVLAVQHVRQLIGHKERVANYNCKLCDTDINDDIESLT